MAGSIMLPDPQRSNLKEIFRRIATESDQEVINLNRFGAETITNWYVQQYPEDFQQKGGDGQIVYMQGDSVKSSATDTEEVEETDDGDDGDDEEKLTFSMSSGPPSNDDE